ncbi:hypothetical protein BBP40_005609 [Aspergillus hancockii]|nr:hypothetical protein BBP40_005609 [Aspergillus hancockii]
MQANELRAISDALSTARAFEVQQITAEECVSNGNRLVQYKPGNIAKVTQVVFGLDHPDYGFLLASTFVYEEQQSTRKQCIKPYLNLGLVFVLRNIFEVPT